MVFCLPQAAGAIRALTATSEGSRALVAREKGVPALVQILKTHAANDGKIQVNALPARIVQPGDERT